MGFDATSLHHLAVWEKNSVHPEKSGIAFKLSLNDVYVEAFFDQTFNQDGNESAILKTKSYNPPDLIFQPLPVKEEAKNIEVNRKRNGDNIDVLTSFYFQETVEIGGN